MFYLSLSAYIYKYVLLFWKNKKKQNKRKILLLVEGKEKK